MTTASTASSNVNYVRVNAGFTQTAGAGPDPIAARQAAERELHELLGVGVGSVSDDEILLQVGQYTATLDAQVNDQLTGMRDNARKSRELSAALGCLTACENSVVDKTLRATTNIHWDQPVNVTLPDGTAGTISLRNLLKNNGVAIPSETYPMNEANMASLRESLKNALEGIRGGGEIRQLEMQQVLSRRNQTLQVVSNVMASRSETRKSIAQNIRG